MDCSAQVVVEIRYQISPELHPYEARGSTKLEDSPESLSKCDARQIELVQNKSHFSGRGECFSLSLLVSCKCF